MTVLFVVLPLAVALSCCAAFAFAWAARRGQFDDLDTPAVRLLCDELPEHEKARQKSTKEEPP